MTSATRWTPGRPPTPASAAEPAGEGVLWVEIAGDGANADELYATLSAGMPGLEPGMLGDLLEPDHYPQGRRYDDGRIRLVSTFSVAPRDDVDHAHRGVFPGPGELVVQPIEILAGDGWLVSCWHPRRVYRGIRVSATEPPMEHQDLIGAVEAEWVAGQGRTSGDLGVMLMHELSLSYAPAHRKLYDWLEEAELSLYLTNHTDREELARLWASMTLLRHWLTPLNLVGLRSNADKAWLPGITDREEAKRADDLVDRSLAALRDLATALRSAFSAVYAQLEQRERDRREATQRRIELVAAGFLVPTLIVGFFGANTWLPAEGSQTGKIEAFIAMVIAIVALTSIAVGFLWLWHRRQQVELRELEAERERLAESLREAPDAADTIAGWKTSAR
jgi:Mg2+ and Co2+ transporter CorA